MGSSGEKPLFPVIVKGYFLGYNKSLQSLNWKNSLFKAMPNKKKYSTKGETV